jgi:hypothetical protein
MTFEMLALSLAITLVGQVAPAPTSEETDGQYHPVVEGSYSFDCLNIRAEISYRQERVPLERAGSLNDSLRVTLQTLSTGGRSVSSGDLARAQVLFRSFAWINRLDATCYQGRVTISVNGMPLEPFISSINNDGDLPALRTKSIRLSRNGIESID